MGSQQKEVRVWKGAYSILGSFDLGHGIEMDKEKVVAITGWMEPGTLKALRGSWFLQGIIGGL